MSIKLMIDSASDISEKEANELGIVMMPIEVRFGADEEYLDGVNLLPRDFYEKLEKCSELPKTSQINPFRFEEEFEKLTANGDQVVVITLSSKLSGTYQSAVEASKKYEGKVYVVDSLNACIGERLLGLYALELIKKGLDIKEIVDNLNESKKRIRVIAVLNTLKYLKMGGRISPTVAFAGELFSVKPVVCVDGGEVQLLQKAIGFKKGQSIVNSLVKESGGIDFSMPYGVVWSGLDESVATKYIEFSKDIFASAQNIPTYMMGCTIGTHIGPGIVGISYFER